MDTNMRICLSVLVFCLAHSASSQQSSPSDDYSVGMKLFLNSYSACKSHVEPINCLKLKFLRLTDKMLNATSVAVFDGVDLVSKPDTMGRSLSFDQEEEPLYSSNMNEDDRESKIDSLIWHRLHSIIKYKSLQFNMPKLVEKSRQLIELPEEEDSVDGTYPPMDQSKNDHDISVKVCWVFESFGLFKNKQYLV
ncbi:hypothetical protein WDU94_001987 [Cyamophila willieti]